jgi:hypothetical protein
MKKTLFIRLRVEEFDDKNTDKNIEKALTGGVQKAIADAGFEAKSVELLEFTAHAVS